MPTKVRLRSATLDGQRINQYVSGLSVYESMCTPYRKAEFTVIDNSGWVAEIAASRPGSLAGIPMSFSFDAGEEVYSSTEMVIQSVKSTPSPENRTSKIYTIGCIGRSYVNDRKNLVQKAFTNIPASSAASLIHNQFIGSDAPLQLLQNTIGMIAKDTIGSFPINNVHPFLAIQQILERATYGGAYANPTVYFRNRDAYVLAPLQQLFQTATPAVTIHESATWGTNIGHMFDDAHYAVIAATLLLDPEDGKRAGSNLSRSASAAVQNLNIFDAAGNIQTIKKFASLTSLSGLVQAAAGLVSRQGGSLNNFLFNSLQNNISSEPAIGRIQEQEFLARTGDADKYLIKYPIRAGIKTTAGGGLNARLIGPRGALGVRQIGGLMLIADLMHELYFDDRPVQGTTTVRCVRCSDVV